MPCSDSATLCALFFFYRFPCTTAASWPWAPGSRGRWLHAVLKEPDVAELRVNGTLRFYDLPQGSALCACGSSEAQATA